MLTQAIPPTQQPFKYFGTQAVTSMPQGTTTFSMPRMPMPNMYAPFNQYKQINVPPPNVIVPPPAVPDPSSQPVAGMPPPFYSNQLATDIDARRQQRKSQRRTVDYNASVIQQIKNRVWRKSSSSVPSIQPDVLCYVDLASPKSVIENPVNAVTTRFVRTATNKIRCPIFSLSWTPEGRRLITGSSSGEFTLWGGLAFNFETVLQAHESAVRTMEWSHNDTWLLSADHSGCVKYWQSNMNNVKTLQAHTEPVRGVGFSPTDNKFASCSDDGTVKIWDFYRCHEERVLRGHGADVKCLGWHPTKGLLVSGSKDSQQPLKLWDPKSGSSLSTIHIHKSTVMDLQWNRNGDWLLTASRDHLIKVFDIRAMKEIQTFRGHKKEATAIDWHPAHESLFASGGSDGAIMFWDMGSSKEVGSMDHAHDAMIWSVRWHPLGHILASGSNDHTCKFWTRNRPGDKMKDKYNLNTNPLGDDDYEYDIPCENDTSELNTSDMNTSNADESVPGLAMGTSAASSLPVPTAEGIPGIDMQFPSADKVKEQQEAKQKMLQSARQSGFKLPNLSDEGEKLNVNLDGFRPKGIANSKFGTTSLGGGESSLSKSLLSAPGLLPTPDKSLLLDPQPDCKGVFDPLTIQPGFVIDALEIWVNEKFSSDDTLQVDNRLKKRGRKPENLVRSRFDSEDSEAERGFQQSQDKPQENRMEPPEKRSMPRPPMHPGISGPPPRQMDDSMRMRHPPPQFRSRPPSVSENYPPFRPQGTFRPHLRPQGENMSSLDRGVDEGDYNEWKETPGHHMGNRHGMPGSRGRGRGFGHSAPRDSSMQRDNQFYPDEDGNRMAQEQHTDQPWRSKGRAEDNEGQGAEDEWNDPNFVPQQRRGPHPLLLRGHHPGGPRRFPPPNEVRGMPFEGSGPPPMRQGPPQRTPHPRHPPHEGQEGFHPLDQSRPPNPRSFQKLRGLMDGISRPAKEQWQGDRTGGGR